MWPFKRKPKDETRASGTGYTAEVIAAREAYVSGTRGLAELTATAQSCVSLWEQGMALADVSGTTLLDRRTMALAGRSLALRGEAVFLIGDMRLIPATDWDVSTRGGAPRAYRLSLPEAGGGTTQTALAAEVLHLRTGCDPAAPWLGSAPLRRANLTASLLHAVESALSETFETAPLGSKIVHLPDSGDGDADTMRRAFRGRRGSVLVIEGQAHAVAAGQHPLAGKQPDDLTPDLSKAMTRETLAAARDGIAAAFGVLPVLFNPAVTGPAVREAQRHLAQWQLQPLAVMIAEEASAKLGGQIALDVMRPLQAFDAGGRARAMSGIIQALAAAKEAGVDPALALKLVDWERDGSGP